MPVIMVCSEALVSGAAHLDSSRHAHSCENYIINSDSRMSNFVSVEGRFWVRVTDRVGRGLKLERFALGQRGGT